MNPCLWMDGTAREAAAFYESVFSDAKSLGGSGVMAEIQVADLRLSLLDGGPQFKINPSISFFYNCGDQKEIGRLWAALSAGGSELMPLGNYPFAAAYGWLADRFGVNWQLILPLSPPRQKAFPSLMFTQGNSGRAEEALKLYGEVFAGSSVGTVSRYAAGQAPDKEGTLNYAELALGTQWISLMDSAQAHQFGFSEGVSLIVTCDSQAEIDHFWDGLSRGGSEIQCGWLKDRFGVSWQVVPRALGELMSDPGRAPRVMEALLKMKKLDLAALLGA